MSARYYFAYGANTNLAGMQYRCPKARPVGAAVLEDWSLLFRGVADVVEHGGARVHGAVWVITPECEASLDRFEGFPRLYTKQMVPVRLGDGRTVRAMVYVMAAREYLQGPSDYYENVLREGYREFGLPTSQIDEAVRYAERWEAEEELAARGTEDALDDGEQMTLWDDMKDIEEWADRIARLARKHGRAS